jgi:ABC-type transport system substrate-binding protein
LNATPEGFSPHLEQKMSNKLLAVLGVAATLTFAACSSSEVKPTSTSNSTSAVNSTDTSTSLNPANSNTALPANGLVPAPQPVDSNGSTDIAGIQSPLSPQMQNRLNKVQKDGGPSGPPVDPAALAMKLARPAPDNSTFTSYLSDAGYEIRTFKDHPQLKKVEKITSEKGVTIKVFLRNGQVVELPGEAIKTLSTAPANQIMSAAGIAPAPGKNLPDQSAGKKGN